MLTGSQVLKVCTVCDVANIIASQPVYVLYRHTQTVQRVTDHTISFIHREDR